MQYKHDKATHLNNNVGVDVLLLLTFEWNTTTETLNIEIRIEHMFPDLFENLTL